MSLVRSSLAGLMWCLGCSGGSGFPDAGPSDAPPASARFSVTWSIADGGRTLTCDDIGALVVAVEVSGPDIGGGYVEAFTCVGAIGTSKALPAGTYDLAFELVGRSGTLGTLASQRVSLRDNQVVEAAPIRFPVVASGTVVGANIAAMTLLLEKQGGACVPTTFEIGAGANHPASTYVSTCAIPTPVAPCIERDQPVTAIAGSGEHVLRVRGAVGAATCWSADQLTDVPPARRTLRVDVGLTSLKGTAGCP
jgi:hypothetical protein